MFKKLRSYRDIVWSIAKLAFPITFSQLGQVLMGFFDVVMLGKYNTLSMSAAGFGNAMFFLFILIGMGTLYAVSTLTSIAVGEERPQQSLPIFFSALKVTILMSVLLMGVNLLVYENLHLFKQSHELTKLGGEFILIVNYSVPGLLLFNCGKQVMDGLGKTQISMMVTGFGLVLNIALNYVLIFGNLGFPEMGLAGAAWATVIARYAMAIIMLSWTWWHPLIKSFRQDAYEKISYFNEILKIGIPIGFTFFFEIAAFSIALVFAGQISNLHSAAHQIAINLASVTYMFITGIAAAGNIVVGNHYGANDAVGIRRSGFAAIYLTVVVELLFAIIFLVFYKQLPLIYTNDLKLLEITPPLILLAAFFQLSDGLQAIGAGVLRGIKDTKVTSLIAFVSYWIIMIPGAFYLCFFSPLGIQGIWWAFVIGLTIAAIWLLYRFNYKSKPENLHFEHIGNSDDVSNHIVE